MVILARSARSIPRARPDVRTEPYPRYGDRRTEDESRGSPGGRDANDQVIVRRVLSIERLRWDRANPGVRMFGVAWSTLFATSDNGATWSALVNTGSMPGAMIPNSRGSGPDQMPFTQFAIPGSSQIATLFSYGCQGLFYALDGTNFSQAWITSGGASNPDNCVQSMAGDDLTGSLYVSTLGTTASLYDPAHVWRSCPWSAGAPCLSFDLTHNTGLPVGTTAAGIVWTGNADRLAAIVPDGGGGTSQVYLYTGALQTCTNPPATGVYWCGAESFPTSVSFTAQTIAYPGSDQLLVGNVDAWQATSYGGPWTDFTMWSGSGQQHPDTREFYWDNGLGSLWASTDGTFAGPYANIVRWTWSIGTVPSSPVTIPTAAPTNTNGLPVWQPYVLTPLAASNASGVRLYLGAQDNGALCSDDRGVSWNTFELPNAPACTQGSRDVPAIAGGGNAAYLRMGNSCEFWYAYNVHDMATCSAVSWAPVVPNFHGAVAILSWPTPWTHAMVAVDPRYPNIVYFVRQTDVGYSNNSGVDIYTSSPLPSGNPVSAYVNIYGTLIVGTAGGGAYWSNDHGGTWYPLALNTASPALILDIAYSTYNNTYFLATTDGLYEGIYPNPFTLKVGGGGYVVDTVSVDPLNTARVIAGLGFVAGQMQHRGGIDVSCDGGGTWTNVTAGLPLHQAPIAQVAADPTSSEYTYAAVYEQGAWQYDTGSPPMCPLCSPRRVAAHPGDRVLARRDGGWRNAPTGCTDGRRHANGCRTRHDDGRRQRAYLRCCDRDRRPARHCGRRPRCRPVGRPLRSTRRTCPRPGDRP